MTRSKVWDVICLLILAFLSALCLYIFINPRSLSIFDNISENIPTLWYFPILMIPFLWRAFRVAVLGAPAILDHRGIYRIHGVNGYHFVPWSSVTAIKWVRPHVLRIGYIAKVSKRMIRVDLPCSIDKEQRSELNAFIRQANPRIEFLGDVDKADC